jgi:MFS transporter, PPP family, 3-phenylpropionic acid transporter
VCKPPAVEEPVAGGAGLPEAGAGATALVVLQAQFSARSAHAPPRTMDLPLRQNGSAGQNSQPLSTTWALRLYYVAAFGALGAYLPYFPAWLTLQGYVGFEMSAITALLPAMSIVAPPLFGLLADSFGLRSSLLRLSSAGACVAFIAISLQTLAGQPPRFAPLFAAVLVFALFRSPMILLADVVALEQAPDYGRLRLWGSLGFLGMALVAGNWLDGAASVGIPATIAVCLLLAFFSAAWLPAGPAVPARPAWTQAKSLLKSSDFVLFLLAAFLWLAAHAGYDLCITLHLRDLGASGRVVGAAWAIATGIEVAWMAGSTRVLKVVGPQRLFAVGVAAAALRWLLLGSITQVWWLLLLQPLHALSFGVVWIAAVAHLKERSQPALATAQGLFGSALSLGGVSGMLVWGPLYQRSGGSAVFRMCWLVGSLAFLAALAFVAVSRDKEASAS